MKTDLKVGDRVKFCGADPLGTVQKIEGSYATVTYEPRPGTITLGYYPVIHLEKVEPDRLPVGGPPSPQPSPRGEGAMHPAKPRASTKDVLPSAL